AMLHVVEVRLRVEVASSAAAMSAAWRAAVPATLRPIPGLPDTDEVARSMWASWVRDAASVEVEVDAMSGGRWEEVVRSARARLAEPYRDAVARSLPDLEAIRSAVQELEAAG
ncbi:MAG: hypothetical protein HKN46_07595, partial [Acidimicrobiia bacterium]|nr:hypothetical protein [Acidimicrobiia bacterium]